MKEYLPADLKIEIIFETGGLKESKEFLDIKDARDYLDKIIKEIAEQGGC